MDNGGASCSVEIAFARRRMLTSEMHLQAMRVARNISLQC